MVSSKSVLLRMIKGLEKVVARNVSSASPLHIKRAVVLTKMTRYEIEKYRHSNLTEQELDKLLRSRGSRVDSLMEHHRRHKLFEQDMLKALRDQGVHVQPLTKSEYTKSWIEWSDAVFPVGGDGTFLLAASRVCQNTKPVIGFNSDPDHSEGHLCLPRSHDVKHVLHRLQEGNFSWMLRTRIRVTVKSKEGDPVQQLWNNRTQDGMEWVSSEPVLALNEVFIGENMSAQVTSLEMRVEAGLWTRLKSSGLCLSTGTGSSSWHMSMNQLTAQCVDKVLQYAGISSASCDCHAIASKYNQALLFHPEEEKMCYTIRDLITGRVWPSPPGLAPQGFTQAVWVRSHCHDARLNIDGGVSFPFNDGAQACFTINPEDALRTIVL